MRCNQRLRWFARPLGLIGLTIGFLGTPAVEAASNKFEPTQKLAAALDCRNVSNHEIEGICEKAMDGDISAIIAISKYRREEGQPAKSVSIMDNLKAVRDVQVIVERGWAHYDRSKAGDDFLLAVTLFRMAEKMLDPTGIYSLAYVWSQSHSRQRPDIERLRPSEIAIFGLYETAAKLGHRDAAFALFRIYDEGQLGIPRNRELANFWREEYVEGGYKPGRYADRARRAASKSAAAPATSTREPIRSAAASTPSAIDQERAATCKRVREGLAEQRQFTARGVDNQSWVQNLQALERQYCGGGSQSVRQASTNASESDCISLNSDHNFQNRCNFKVYIFACRQASAEDYRAQNAGHGSHACSWRTTADPNGIANSVWSRYARIEAEWLACREGDASCNASMRCLEQHCRERTCNLDTEVAAACNVVFKR